MRKTWRTLGVMLSLSIAACTGCNNDSDNNNNNGNDNDGTTEKIVCSGTYTGGATGKVKFCSLQALKTGGGQLQYTLDIEPDTSGTVVSNDSLTLFSTGEPKKGTFALETFSQAISKVTVQGDKSYELLRNGGEQTGKATLTIDSVPAGQNLSGGNFKYENITGKAEIQYVAPQGATYTDTVTLTLTIQAQK
jgi:hypothetical protein